MQFNEFRRPISVDFVPHGSLCEWCREPAKRQLTAIGGVYHNDGGMFCRPCGEKFLQTVIDSLKRDSVIITQVETYEHLGISFNTA